MFSRIFFIPPRIWCFIIRVPHLKKIEVMNQNFHKLTTPNHNWSEVDHIIIEDDNEMIEQTKLEDRGM